METAHLQLLTLETRKEWNLDNSFVFKVKHTPPQNFVIRRFTTVLRIIAKDSKFGPPMKGHDPSLQKFSITTPENEGAL